MDATRGYEETFAFTLGSRVAGMPETCAITSSSRALDVAHFWFLVDDTAGKNACWPWLGSIQTKGYGQFRINGRRVVAHRIAYELTFGPIPNGLQLDHVKARGCTTRSCCNPRHLEAVTAQVNILRSDSASAAHARKTHCPRGHAYDLINTHIYEGRRYCRSCSAINSRASRARKKAAA